MESYIYYNDYRVKRIDDSKADLRYVGHLCRRVKIALSLVFLRR